MAHRGLSANEIAGALISMLARSTTLQSEAGYIDARPLSRDRRTLLRRTAGPYIGSRPDQGEGTSMSLLLGSKQDDVSPPPDALSLTPVPPRILTYNRRNFVTPT